MVIIITDEEEKENVPSSSNWMTKSLDVEKRENVDWKKKGLNVKVIEDFQKLKKRKE